MFYSKPFNVQYILRNIRNFSDQRYFDKILIANRGEISCRIINTTKKMGIKTVSVYSDPDCRSKHVQLSDESINIGPASANESYLNMEKILDAIKTSNSQAVHPGYGFLSENAKFVQLLEKENISFIGPSSEVIKKMGDKLESKRIAISAGVNTIPGYDGVVKNEDHCIEIAKEIGYPVMIKASAGGGGKGMRVAWKEDDIREGFKLSTQEALSSFGDGRILLEKFIQKPRHIEIQVLGDKYGNVVYLGERECSIQRRNQKIIEEAPSTFLDEKTRKEMGDQAVMLCKLLGYSSAGTVEFLVDENRDFYFLEMNTRLQVEHPVTECITGVDLVEQMIKIAAGQKLHLKQNDIRYKGWAIESRIYAENPFKNFGMPSVGKINKYIEPHIEGVRFDTGVTVGSDINVYYDPLICKLISYGATRKEAIEKNIQALDRYVIQGVTHNIPLLRDILTENKFQNGDLSTNYLNETYPDGFKGHKLKKDELNKLITFSSAVYALLEDRNRYLNPNKLLKNWCVEINIENEKHFIEIKKFDQLYEIKINNDTFHIDKNINISSALIQTKINDENCVFQLISRDGIGNFDIIYNANHFKVSITALHISKYLSYMQNRPNSKPSKFLKAPMPGLIKSVSCKTGDKINTGQEICVLEAMKMQNCISAVADGIVKSINIKEGDIVANNDILVEFE